MMHVTEPKVEVCAQKAEQIILVLVLTGFEVYIRLQSFSGIEHATLSTLSTAIFTYVFITPTKVLQKNL